MTRRPSEARPDGFLKYVIPNGYLSAGKAAQKPPVSEFESPKLKIAGNEHFALVEGVINRRTRRNIEAKKMEKLWCIAK